MAQHNKAFRCDDGDYDGDNGAEHGGNHNNQSINNAKISPEITPDLTSSLDQRPDPLKATPTTVTYDELMGIVGGFGVAQFLVFLSYSLGIFVECQVVMAFVFAAGAHRDHHCREPGLNHLNLSDTLARNISTGGLDKCHMYFRDYSTWTPETVQYWLDNFPNVTTDVTTCHHGYVFDPYPYTNTIITQWDLVCDDEWKGFLPYSVVGIGQVVGALMWGFIIDRYGRMYPYIYTLLAMVLLSLVSSFSPYYYVYCILQFFIGIHAIATFTIGPTVLVEITGIKIRGHITTAFNYFWTLGYLLVPLVSYLLRDWSHLQLCISVYSLLSLVLLVFLKESPRWLYLKNERQKAEKILKVFAKSNKREFPEHLKVVVEEDMEKSGTVKDLFTSGMLLAVSTVLFFSWFSNSLLYFGLSLYLPTMSADHHLNFFISGLVEIPGYLIAQLSIAYLPRRASASALFACAGVFLISLLTIESANLAPLKIALALGGKMIATGLMSLLGCFTSEIFPTVTRGSGRFLCLLFGNLANITAPQLNLLDKCIPPIIFASFAISAAFLCLFLPETKDQPLCDTIKEMKEKRKIASFKNCLRFHSPLKE